MSMRSHSLINITINGNIHLRGNPGFHVSRVSTERIDKDFGKKATCSNSFGACYWLEDQFSGFLLIS